MSEPAELEIPEEQLRQLLVANRGKHFPAHLRHAAVAYWKVARGRGVSRYRISQALGMNLTTLLRWVSSSECAPGTTAMRPVQVVEEPVANSVMDRSKIVVHTSSGLRIEGLDIKALAELVRYC
jgi:hypothetical protein